LAFESLGAHSVLVFLVSKRDSGGQLILEQLKELKNEVYRPRQNGEQR
jgi:hypothetical protein